MPNTAATPTRRVVPPAKPAPEAAAPATLPAGTPAVVVAALALAAKPAPAPEPTDADRARARAMLQAAGIAEPDATQVAKAAALLAPRPKPVPPPTAAALSATLAALQAAGVADPTPEMLLAACRAAKPAAPRAGGNSTTIRYPDHYRVRLRPDLRTPDANPKSGASRARFAGYYAAGANRPEGATVAECLRAGVTRADLRFDTDPARRGGAYVAITER